MSKNKTRIRTKFDKDGNPITGKAPNTPAPTDRNHKPRIERHHIAQELRDRNQIEEAESITRGLMPHLRGRVMGLKDTHYRYPGFSSTARRDILPLKMRTNA